MDNGDKIGLSTETTHKKTKKEKRVSVRSVSAVAGILYGILYDYNIYYINENCNFDLLPELSLVE